MANQDDLSGTHAVLSAAVNQEWDARPDLKKAGGGDTGASKDTEISTPLDGTSTEIRDGSHSSASDLISVVATIGQQLFLLQAVNIELLPVAASAMSAAFQEAGDGSNALAKIYGEADENGQNAIASGIVFCAECWPLRIWNGFGSGLFGDAKWGNTDHLSEDMAELDKLIIVVRRQVHQFQLFAKPFVGIRELPQILGSKDAAKDMKMELFWTTMIGKFEENGFPRLIPPFDQLRIESLANAPAAWKNVPDMHGTQQQSAEIFMLNTLDPGRFLWYWTAGKPDHLKPGTAWIIMDTRIEKFSQWLEGLHGIDLLVVKDYQLDFSNTKISKDIKDIWLEDHGNEDGPLEDWGLVLYNPNQEDGHGESSEQPYSLHHEQNEDQQQMNSTFGAMQIHDPAMQNDLQARNMDQPPALENASPLDQTNETVIQPTEKSSGRRPVPKPPPAPIARVVIATHSAMVETEEELNFQKGDIMEVLDDKAEDGWWTARLDGRVGIIPYTYVKDHVVKDEPRRPVRMPPTEADPSGEEASVEHQSTFDTGLESVTNTENAVHIPPPQAPKFDNQDHSLPIPVDIEASDTEGSSSAVPTMISGFAIHNTASPPQVQHQSTGSTLGSMTASSNTMYGSPGFSSAQTQGYSGENMPGQNPYFPPIMAQQQQPNPQILQSQQQPQQQYYQQPQSQPLSQGFPQQYPPNPQQQQPFIQQQQTQVQPQQFQQQGMQPQLQRQQSGLQGQIPQQHSGGQAQPQQFQQQGVQPQLQRQPSIMQPLQQQHSGMQQQPHLQQQHSGLQQQQQPQLQQQHSGMQQQPQMQAQQPQQYYQQPQIVSQGQQPQYNYTMSNAGTFPQPGMPQNNQGLPWSPTGATPIIPQQQQIRNLWNVPNSRIHDPAILYNLTGHTKSVTSLAFAPDSLCLASGSLDKAVRLWDTTTGKFQQMFGHSGPIQDVSFSADGQIIAAAAETGIKLWDVRSRHAVCSISDPRTVSSVNMSPDGNTFAAGMSSNSIMVWDRRTLSQVWTLPGHTGAVRSLAYSPNSRVIASGSQDKTVGVWDIATGSIVQHIKAHSGIMKYVTAVAFSPNGILLASASLDATVKIWEAASGALLLTLNAGAMVHDVTFSADGGLVMAATMYEVKSWSIDGGNLHRFVPHKKSIDAVGMSKDGKYLATGSYDKMVKIWKLGQ